MGLSEQTGEENKLGVSWGKNDHVVIAENLSSKEEESDEEEMVDHENQHNHDYRVNADIPLFYRMMGMDDFSNWRIDVDRFFDIMCIPENKQIRMMTNRLKSTTVVWWNKLVVHRYIQRNWQVKTW